MNADLTIITYKDIFQDEAVKAGRSSEEYQKRSAQIILDKHDMENLGVKDGQSVMVENEVGRVVVVARLSGDESHGGLAFMPNSPWSNQLVTDSSGASAICEFKKIRAKVSISNETETQISELVQRMKA